MMWATDLVETALAIALAADAQGVEASHVEVMGPVLDVGRYLAPKQRECFDEVFVQGAPAIDILGGRQAGKTFLDTAILIQGGIERPGTVNPYFGLTGESVDDIWWPEVVTWWTLLGLPSSGLHRAEHTAVLPDGSMLKGFGTTNVAHVEKRRGTKYNKVAVDEMGAQPDAFVAYFLELIRPTLVKNRGSMVRSGNPGLVCDGYWYDETNAERSATAPLFHFTAWDNPALGTAEEIDAFVSAQLFDSCGLTLAELREQIAECERGERARTGPIVTFEREWLARWGQDASSLVYPFDLLRNGVDALPTHNGNGVLLDVARWRYIACCDPAGKGYTGFAVMAGHPDLRRRFILSSEKHPGMLIGEAANRLRAFRQQYPRCRLALDAGGLGSVHSQQFAREFALYVENADKRDKASAIAMFRDNLLAGSIGVLNGPCNDAWRGEAAACGWDKQRLHHDPNAEDHCLDSADYDDRLLRTWPQVESEQPPAGPTPEQLAATAKAKRMEAMKRAGHRDWSRMR